MFCHNISDMSVGRLCSQDGHKKAEEGRKGSTMRSTESDSLELHVPSVEENTRFPSLEGLCVVNHFCQLLYSSRDELGNCSKAKSDKRQ